MRPAILALLLLLLATAVIIAPPRLIGRDPLSLDASRTPITFVVWGMPFEDRLFLDRYAKGFERTEPGIRVEYQRHAGNELNMKYASWHAAGRGAEVMRIQVVDYHQMVARGMLEPLTLYINDPAAGLSSERAADFPPHLLNALRIDGTLYALPQDNAVLGLYYNKDIFDAYNAAHPTDTIEYPNARWTWNDLRSAARKLTERDTAGRFETYGIDMVIWQWPFMSFFAQADGKLWSQDGLTTLINQGSAGVEALESLRTLAREDRSWRPYFGRNEGAGPDSRFASGQTAMYLDGSWMAPNFELRNPKLRFAIAPVPRGKVDAALTGACLWGISSRAANKAAGWRMLRWLTAPEQASEYWQTLRVAPPASLSVIRSQSFRSTTGIPLLPPGRGFEVPPMSRELFDDRAAWIAHAYEPGPTGRAPGFVPTSLYERVLEDEIARMLQEYLRSDVDAKSALDAAARSVHQAIDRDRAAKGLQPVLR